MIHYKQDICKDFHNATQYEWIETNGIGGYASSTIIGSNTRRYHGLLVAAQNPPARRVVLLSKVEETVMIGQDKFELSSNQYPDTIYPTGNMYLKEFRLRPFPKFIYEIKGITIEKTVSMVKGANTTLISYNFFTKDQGVDEVTLSIRPLINFRNYHSITSREDDLKCECDIYEGAVKISPYSEYPPLYLYHNAVAYNQSKCFYRNMEYQEDAYRGFECHETLLNPGYFIYNIEDSDNCVFVASTELYDEIDTMELMQNEISRKSQILRKDRSGSKELEPLILSSDSLICDGFKKGTKAIIAGYHWFSVWVRDQLIALPGLTLAQGRHDVAQDILSGLSGNLNKGMLPNNFSEDMNEPLYNSVDVSLWYFYAVYKYLEYTDNYEFAERELYSSLTKIINAYIKGTRFGLHEDTDGLIVFESGSEPLTWMDVKYNGIPVSPRSGKVVEMNALWYNALLIMSQIAAKMNNKKEADVYAAKAEKTKKSFRKIFWYHKGGYLYDYVDGNKADTSLRPNQIFAISLPFSILPKAMEKQILSVIEDQLLTLYGLRTLSAGDPDYKGIYRGGIEARELSYHQGTVWAWLIGPYADAYIKVNGSTSETKSVVKKLIAPFLEHLKVAGLGSISEIFDGDYPHHPRGCISQAWSVGEVLRIYYEVVVGVKDKPKKEDTPQKTTKRF